MVEHIGPLEYERLAILAAKKVDPDLDPTAMALIFNLMRVSSRTVKDVEATVFREMNVSFAAFRVMFSLRTAGSASPNELARFSGISTASMSSLLATMTRNGLIVRKPDSGDRRRQLIDLSEVGNTKLDRLIVANHARERLWASALSEEECAILVMLLRRLLLTHPPSGGSVTVGESDGSVIADDGGSANSNSDGGRGRGMKKKAVDAVLGRTAKNDNEAKTSNNAKTSKDAGRAQRRSQHHDDHRN